MKLNENKKNPFPFLLKSLDEGIYTYLSFELTRTNENHTEYTEEPIKLFIMAAELFYTDPKNIHEMFVRRYNKLPAQEIQFMKQGFYIMDKAASLGHKFNIEQSFWESLVEAHFYILENTPILYYYNTKAVILMKEDLTHEFKDIHIPSCLTRESNNDNQAEEIFFTSVLDEETYNQMKYFHPDTKFKLFPTVDRDGNAFQPYFTLGVTKENTHLIKEKVSYPDLGEHNPEKSFIILEKKYL